MVVVVMRGGAWRCVVVWWCGGVVVRWGCGVVRGGVVVWWCGGGGVVGHGGAWWGVVLGCDGAWRWVALGGVGWCGVVRGVGWWCVVVVRV